MSERYVIENKLQFLKKKGNIDQYSFAEKKTTVYKISDKKHVFIYPIEIHYIKEYLLRLIKDNKVLNLTILDEDLDDIESIVTYNNNWKRKSCIKDKLIVCNVNEDKNILSINDFINVNFAGAEYNGVYFFSDLKIHYEDYLKEVKVENLKLDIRTKFGFNFKVSNNYFVRNNTVSKLINKYTYRFKKSIINEDTYFCIISYEMINKILLFLYNNNEDNDVFYQDYISSNDYLKFSDYKKNYGHIFYSKCKESQYVFIDDIVNYYNINLSTGDYVFVARNAVVFKDGFIVNISNIKIKGNFYDEFMNSKYTRIKSMINGSRYYDLAIMKKIFFV